MLVGRTATIDRLDFACEVCTGLYRAAVAIVTIDVRKATFLAVHGLENASARFAAVIRTGVTILTVLVRSTTGVEKSVRARPIRLAEIFRARLLIIAFVVACTAVYEDLVFTGAILTGLSNTDLLHAVVIGRAAIGNFREDTGVFEASTKGAWIV